LAKVIRFNIAHAAESERPKCRSPDHMLLLATATCVAPRASAVALFANGTLNSSNFVSASHGANGNVRRRLLRLQ
jgi:hypothetical protein